MDCFEILRLSPSDRHQQLLDSLHALVGTLGDGGTLLIIDIERIREKTDEIAVIDGKKTTGYHSSEIVKALGDMDMEGVDVLGDLRFQWVRTMKSLSLRCFNLCKRLSANILVLYRRLPQRRARPAFRPRRTACSLCSKRRKSLCILMIRLMPSSRTDIKLHYMCAVMEVVVGGGGARGSKCGTVRETAGMTVELC